MPPIRMLVMIALVTDVILILFLATLIDDLGFVNFVIGSLLLLSLTGVLYLVLMRGNRRRR